MARPHSPGPWSVVKSTPSLVEADFGEKGLRSIAQALNQTPYIKDGEVNANARLIAAAPTLLLTVKLLLQHMTFDPEGELDGPEWDEMTARAQRVVDQAEGR